MSSCDDIRLDLAGYVLHGLDPDEAAAVETHLRTCADCRVAYDEIAGTPALLELAREAPPQAPPHLRDRVLSDVAARRWDRRRLAVSVAAALVTALLGGAVGWQLALTQRPAVAVAMESGEEFDAAGWATFRPAPGGLVVDLRLQGLEPLAEPATYEAWLYTHDERVVSLGQLSPQPDGSARVELSADGSQEAYRGVWVTAEPDARDPAHDGPTVLWAPVPPGR